MPTKGDKSAAPRLGQSEEVDLCQDSEPLEALTGDYFHGGSVTPTKVKFHIDKSHLRRSLPRSRTSGEITFRPKTSGLSDQEGTKNDTREHGTHCTALSCHQCGRISPRVWAADCS
jgi:hypothetical protein